MVSNSSALKIASMKPLSEYGAASKRLGEVFGEHPTSYILKGTPVVDIISKQLGELPIVCSLLPFLQLFKSNFENFFILGILRLFR